MITFEIAFYCVSILAIIILIILAIDNKKKPETDEKTRIIQSMQKLEIEDDDVIVLRHPHALEMETIMALTTILKKTIKKFTGCDVNIIVLEEGMTLDLLRKKIGENDKCNETKS